MFCFALKKIDSFAMNAEYNIFPFHFELKFFTFIKK